ncbi:MAG: OmpA family protein [Phycisphaeraceae bacterium]|nr:OmpA family protein [Phycisphaeraceae bacterium]
MAEHEEHKEKHGGESHGGGGHGAHGGGGHAEGEHEGAPEWLISFADFVALMMGFFVILLAMNMQKPKAGGIGGEAKMGGAPSVEMIDFVIAMRKEFKNPINLDSDNPAEAPFRQRIRELQAGQSRQPENQGEGREAQAIVPTEFSNLGGRVYFEDDSTTLSDRAREQARAIGVRLRDQRFIVEVRGHVSPSEAQSNTQRAFNLAHARSLAVASELIAQGLNPRQLRLSTAADNERTTPREASYDRLLDRQNQRVEVILTGEVFNRGDAIGGNAAPAKRADPGH